MDGKRAPDSFEEGKWFESLPFRHLAKSNGVAAKRGNFTRSGKSGGMGQAAGFGAQPRAKRIHSSLFAIPHRKWESLFCVGKPAGFA